MLHCRSVSHQNTPLSIREKLDMSVGQQAEWLQSLDSTDAVVLSTCNRLELYAVAHSVVQMDVLWADLLQSKQVRPEEIAPYVTRIANYHAAHHLFEVTGGLRSMALGESQILGQVSGAFQLAQESGTCGHRMSLLFRSAIHAAKQIQTHTEIGYGNSSVSSLGINKLEESPGSLEEREILVVGAGEMGQSVIKGLSHRGITNVHLVSRTFEKARQVAQLWNIRAYPLTHLKELLVAADIVFMTSSAPYPILSVADMQPIMNMRSERELFIVDIAVPRDVDPDVAQIHGIHLFDLDVLQQVVDTHYQQREQAIPQAHAIINEELARFWESYQSLAVVPTIRMIREHVNHLREQELERIYNKLNGHSTDDVTALFEEFSKRFMNKVLHQPTAQLRARAGEHQESYFTSVARDLFGIEEDNP